MSPLAACPGRITAPAATASSSRMREQIADADQVCACDGHPSTDLEFVGPRPGMVDRGGGVRLPVDERPQQRLVGEAPTGLQHVREEEIVGILDACSALERRAGKCEPSSAQCGAASQPIALLHEGDTPSVRGEALRRRQACESSPDDDRLEFQTIPLRHRRPVTTAATRRCRPGIVRRRPSRGCWRQALPPRRARACAKRLRPQRVVLPFHARPR